MKPFYESRDGSVVLYHGDCREVLAGLEAGSVHSVVTDPPYEIGFMGRAWDSSGVAFQPATWEACSRVLKPGGHLLAFGATRTVHRIACAIEDAGWEIRDMLSWLYGTGFPRSLNVSKAIASGGGRPEDIRRMQLGVAYAPSGRGRVNYDHGAASAMDGARVDWTPDTDTARQWAGWGTALRPSCEPVVMARKPLAGTVASNILKHGAGALNVKACRLEREDSDAGWPANVILDEEVARAMEESSRYFYVPKPSPAERGEANDHPTLKPLMLMRYLCRLVTAPGSTVLDPFAGSGTTLLAARREGF